MASPDRNNASDRSERELRDTVEAAEAVYHDAVAGIKNALAEFESMHHHPDGSHALHQAARKETAALQKYRLALTAYREFLEKRHRDRDPITPD